MRRGLTVALLLWLTLGGCENAPPPPAVKPPPPPVSAKPAAPPAAAPAAEATREKAAVGMGEQGRGYGEGFVGTPIKALWRVKETLVLERIEHDLQLFKAQDPQGRGPKTHAEFMEKIVKDGGIRLPALPQGQRYVYDPAKEELFVEQPKEP
jgi:hypothetical protein